MEIMTWVWIGIAFYIVVWIIATACLRSDGRSWPESIGASPDILHHTPEDDDRSAITFWLPNAKSFTKEDLAEVFERMAYAIRQVHTPEPNG